MYLLQSVILVQARMEEITRPYAQRDTRTSPPRSRSALQIRLDARRARRKNPAG